VARKSAKEAGMRNTMTEELYPAPAKLSEIKALDLVPMSIEELRMLGRKNTRAKGVVQLWYVDGLGRDYMFLGREIQLLELDKKFPDYIKRNLGIKKINHLRQELHLENH
jgi:hypothetical protein